MTATVITVSPRVALADLERLAHARLDRDGVAVFAAVTADGRQLSHLRRLRDRIASDSDVFFSYADRVGATYLTVFAAGQQPPVGWMGGPKTDEVEDPDGGYWDGPDS